MCFVFSFGTFNNLSRSPLQPHPPHLDNWVPNCVNGWMSFSSRISWMPHPVHAAAIANQTPGAKTRKP